MDFDVAIQTILKHLRQHRGAENNVLIELIEGDSELFQKVREHLIFMDLAEDKKGVGLVYLDSEIDEPEKKSDQDTTQNTSQHFTIFISYGRKDAKPLAVKLEKDLASKGHDVWLDTSQMQSGSSWESQIEEAILSHDIFISLLTPHAVRRPDGVCLDEISLARYHNRKIVPVMVIQCRPPLSIYRLDWVDFTGWDEHHNYVKSFERVNRAIHSQEAVEGLYTEIFSNLKPLDFGVDIARLTIDFTGRQWLFDEVDQWLMKSSSKVFFITGDPGIGKSAIMAHLASRHPQVMAFHFCVASLADSLNPDSFVRSLAAQLSTQIEDYHDAIKLLNFEQLSRLEPGTLFRRIIADPLKSIQLTEEVVILIDALDEVWEDENHNIVRILHERLEDLPEKVKFIVSSRKNPGIFDLLSKYQPHEIDPARAENIIDINTYLDKKLNSSAIKTNLPREATYLDDIKQSVISKSEGNFLYIKQFIYGIETGQIDIHDVTSYPNGLIGIYTTFFDRIFKGNEDYSNYRDILEIITCLKVPFSAGELSPILQLSEFEIGRKMETLSAFFSVQNGKYFPYHKSITDWLTGAVGSGNKYLLDMEKGRRRLCDFLLKRYEEEDSNPYLLAYLPYHLIESKRYQELTDLLLDFRFIIQKCREGMVYELIKDYHAAFALIPETRIIKKEEKEYLEKMAEYTRQLISAPDKVYEEGISIESFTPWSDRQIETEIERIETSSTTKDKLIIFLQFLDSQAHLLYRYGSLDGFVLQQAYNYAGTGPFAAFVDSYMKKCSYHKLLFTRELREEFNPFDPCLRVFHEHTERVLGVSLTFDGKYAVTGSNDNLMKLWDMQSGECLKTICPHVDYLKSLDATPDLNLVVSSGGSQDPTIKLWNYKDLEPRGKLEGHTDRVNHLKITPDGRFVISCSNDDTVKVWDTNTLECIADFKEHTADVVSVDISIDGRMAASGAYDNTIYIWDIPGRKPLQRISGNDDKGFMGYALTLSHDKKTLYSSAGYEDTTIRAWDVITGNCVKTLSCSEYAQNCLEVTHDERFLVSASMDKTIRIWDLRTDSVIKTIKGHVGPIRSLKITPDLKYIISGGGGKYDSTVRVWNIYKSKLSDDRIISRNIREIQFSPSRDFLLNLSRKVIQIRDPETSQIITELTGHKAHVKQVWLNPQGNQILSASLDKTIRIWDLSTKECIGSLTGHLDGVLDIGVSRDRKKLASCGWDGKILEWDLDKKQLIKAYPSKETCIIYVAFIHDDRHILSIGYENNVKIWDVKTGEILHTNQSIRNITGRSSLDNSDNIYLGLNDGSIQYWDTHKNELQLLCQGHRELVSCFELVESEQYLFSGSSDCMIGQWDTKTGDCLGIFEGHTDELISIRKIPGQDKIISASWDHSIRVWDIYSRKCVAVLPTNLLVTSLSKVQNNGRFAYGTIQGEFKIIDLNQPGD